MRISTTFLIIAFISLLLGTLTILPITQSSLNWSVEQLTWAQKENVRQVLAASFEDKKLYLSNLSNVIQFDANLAGALVLADASRDYGMLSKLLEELRKKSNLEYFEVMPINRIDSKIVVVSTCLRTFAVGAEGASLCQNGDKTMIAWLSPIFLYGEKVGMMFLGANLVSSQHLELINDFKQARNEVYRIGNLAVVAELKPNIESIKAVSATLRKLIILGAIIALVFMLIFIGLAIRYFFLEPFQLILSDLDRAFSHIEQKMSFQFDNKKVLAWENRKLILTLEAFVEKIMNYERQLADSNARLIENEKSAALGRLSRQVAHDIRSPLTALQLAIRQVDQFPESYRGLFITAVERINNIANQLLKNYKISSPSAGDESVEQESVLLDSLRVCVQEKFLVAEQKNIEIQLVGKESDGFCLIPLAATPFQNIVSNILTNAIEASSSGMRIVVQFSKRNSKAYIIVQDEGDGIPETVLSRIGKEEITFGKESGNGLGLYSAKQMICKSGGQLSVRSKVGVGTEVQIELPFLESNATLLNSICLKSGAKVIVIDDDKAVHEVWRHRLNELAISQTVLTINFMSVDSFSEWYSKNGSDAKQKYHFFIDYDFHNMELNGIELIKKYGLESQAILVTAHFAEPEIIAKAKLLNIMILPKPILASIPFVIE